MKIVADALAAKNDQSSEDNISMIEHLKFTEYFRADKCFAEP